MRENEGLNMTTATNTKFRIETDSVGENADYPYAMARLQSIVHARRGRAYFASLSGSAGLKGKQGSQVAAIP